MNRSYAGRNAGSVRQHAYGMGAAAYSSASLPSMSIRRIRGERRELALRLDPAAARAVPRLRPGERELLRSESHCRRSEKVSDREEEQDTCGAGEER